MSKLQDLMRELCPDGVEYKKLGEVCDIVRGERVTKNQLKKEGIYPVISGGISPMGYLDNYNREADTITVAQYGTAGYVNWQFVKFWANDVCFCIEPNTTLRKRFLYYILMNNQNKIYAMVNKDATPYHLPNAKLQSLPIPIPPIPIQEEIVRILDRFTNLATELQTELQIRKEQYKYYRNKLLTFDTIGEDAKKSELDENE